MPCLLLELVIVHVSGAVRALLAAGCLLFRGIVLVINIASKHLHNDLARAIKALEQKKVSRHRLGWCGAFALKSGAIFCPLGLV